MSATEYQAQYQGYVSAVEQRLLQLCDQYLPDSARIGQAARYSLLGGGKRVRAVLTMASCEVCGKTRPWRWITPAPWKCCTAIR